MFKKFGPILSLLAYSHWLYVLFYIYITNITVKQQRNELVRDGTIDFVTRYLPVRPTMAI